MAEIEIDITSAQQEQPDIDVHPIYGLKGDKGERGLTGNGISSITLTSTVGLVDTYNVNYTDGNKTSFTVTNGEKGEQGEQGIQGIQGEQGIQGIQGETGATPNITVNASVNNTVGTPSVNVTKTGTDENPIFSLAFQNLKGETGSIDNVTFGDITGQVTDNIALTNAFNSKQDTLISGTNIKTINNNSILGSGNLTLDGLPSQSGQSGKFLTTNGSAASWAEIQTGADVNLSNLTTQGQNISNWSSNVSNCITEIPQDIILELSNGTLTLKAGSKVRIPNGFEVDGTTPKFDTVTIANDITTTDSASRNIWVGVTPDGSAMVFGVDSETGTPVLNTYKFYYDSSANMCYLNVGASSIQASLPICIATSDNSGIVALPNVFNGLGFIGSTVFVLPNVSTLRPYLRNADGTLKIVKSTTSTVLMKTSTNGANDYYLMFDGVNIYLPAKNTINYDVSNCWYDSTNTPLYWVSLGEFSCDAANIVTAFKPKTVFHAADYNDVWAKQGTHVVVETYSNGASWYRVYSDGWCEQGGYTDATSVTYLKTFTNTNYNLQVSPHRQQDAQIYWSDLGYSKTVSGFTLRITDTSLDWQASGYIA